MGCVDMCCCRLIGLSLPCAAAVSRAKTSMMTLALDRKQSKSKEADGLYLGPDLSVARHTSDDLTRPHGRTTYNAQQAQRSTSQHGLTCSAVGITRVTDLHGRVHMHAATLPYSGEASRRAQRQRNEPAKQRSNARQRKTHNTLRISIDQLIQRYVQAIGVH